MTEDEPLAEYFPPDDEETGSPLADALNRFAKTFPTLHDPAEVEHS